MNINNNNLYSYFDKQNISRLDYIIFCLPTPLKNNSFTPDNSYIIKSFDKIYNYLKNNQTIILESTVYPGATREIFFKKLKKKFQLGKNFFLGFSPERINPGDKKITKHKLKFTDITKLLSGLTPACEKKIKFFYSKVFSKYYLCENIEVAEFSKLYENSFRFINISFVNEIKMLCNKMGINFHKVIESSSTKPFGFRPFLPSPGIGGHCIPIDPNFINWKSKKFNTVSSFIKISNKINIKVKKWTVKKIFKEINYIKKNKKKILIIGLTYKKDVNDLRESASLYVYKKIINKKNLSVSYYDPYIKKIELKKIIRKTIKLSKNIISSFDLVVICTDHSNIDYRKILKHSKRIIDTRGIFRRIKNNNKIVNV